MNNREQDVNINTIPTGIIEHANYNVKVKLVLEGCSLQGQMSFEVKLAL